MKLGLDLDGTLISCKQKQLALLGSILKAYGENLKLEEIWMLKRKGANNLQALLTLGVDNGLAQKITRDWCFQIEDYQWACLDTPYYGVLDTLRKLKSAGHSLHVVSARNNKINAFLQMKKYPLSGLFDSVDFVSYRRNERKSDIFIGRKLEVYFGDTEADYMEAKAAKIDCYLMANGMRDAQFLSQYTPQILASFNNALDVV